MKKSHQAFSLLLMTAMLCSCSTNGAVFPLDAYISELQFHDQFLICQLSDLHFSAITDLPKEFKYIDKIMTSYGVALNKSNPGNYRPNLLVINGDAFMNANKYVIDETFKYFDNLGIPYAFTYGNHDVQGAYTTNYIRKHLQESKVAIFKDQNGDDVYGNSNYVINLNLIDDLKFQIYILDSNSYLFGDYDIIHEDQVSWYEKQVLKANGLTSASEVNPDNMIKSLAFFHIPTVEFEEATNQFMKDNPGKTSNGDNFCVNMQKHGSSNRRSTIIKKMQELKSTVGIGVAHDHRNSTDLWYTGDSDWPIRLIYGNKSSSEAKYDERTMGATFFAINENEVYSDNGNRLYFSLTKLLVDYETTPEDKGVTIEWTNQKIV